MTIEEAKAILKLAKICCEYPHGAYSIALDIAIKALEQESVLNKVRAEIMQLDYDTENIDYDYNDMAQTETVHTICREEVLQIINKYKEGGTQ